MRLLDAANESGFDVVHNTTLINPATGAHMNAYTTEGRALARRWLSRQMDEPEPTILRGVGPVPPSRTLPVAPGDDVFSIIDGMGGSALQISRERRPDLFMVHPKSGMLVRNQVPAPREVTPAPGSHGPPRFVDTVPPPMRMGDEVPIGPERPPQYLFRAISEEDWQGHPAEGLHEVRWAHEPRRARGHRR